MSLAFELYEDRRRALERERRWRDARRTLLAWSIGGLLLGFCCAVIGCTYYGFFFL